MTIPNLAWELAGIAVAAVVYLVFDTYPIVKCFRPTFCTGSFYLFWVILSVLNLIAYGALLELGQAGKISPIPIETRSAERATESLADLKTGGKVRGRVVMTHWPEPSTPPGGAGG